MENNIWSKFFDEDGNEIDLEKTQSVFPLKSEEQLKQERIAYKLKRKEISKMIRRDFAKESNGK